MTEKGAYVIYAPVDGRVVLAEDLRLDRLECHPDYVQRAAGDAAVPLVGDHSLTPVAVGRLALTEGSRSSTLS